MRNLLVCHGPLLVARSLRTQSSRLILGPSGRAIESSCWSPMGPLQKTIGHSMSDIRSLGHGAAQVGANVRMLLFMFDVSWYSQTHVIGCCWLLRCSIEIPTCSAGRWKELDHCSTPSDGHRSAFHMAWRVVVTVVARSL